MRGDLKWPPAEYKEAAARENEVRRQIARGPVCRPRKVHRVSRSIDRINCEYFNNIYFISI